MNQRHSKNHASENHWLRSAIDLALCFVIAVMVLKSFVLEGYLISTGSMAPGLLGFHRRLECPECSFSFAYGVSFDESVGPGLSGVREPTGERSQVTCPNCGRNRIDISKVPTSHGDQLLVQKHVYDFRDPRRWETVVFRNPASPDEAYVKRVTGLPGESIRVFDGDVFINQTIARKGFEDQLSCRIPVCSLQHLASDEAWQLPWELDEAWTAEDGSLRCRTGLEGASSHHVATEFGNTGATDSMADSRSEAAATSRPGAAWMRFRYWRWFGGKHVSETPLSLEDAVDFRSYEERFDSMPLAMVAAIEYDDVRQVLRCRGVMTAPLQDELLRNSSRDGFRNAIYRLAALSHLAPVTDMYGYNAMVDNPEFVVNDLMMKITLHWEKPPAAVYVNLPILAESFRVALKPASQKIQLLSVDQKQVLMEASFPFSQTQSDVVLEVSNFDRQIVVAVNGQTILTYVHKQESHVLNDTFEYCLSTPTGEPVDAVAATRITLRHEQQKRWAIGVVNGDVRISTLEMFRDVFYTPGRRRNGVAEEFLVPIGSYFVQGDNSPVSSDSRSWPAPCVSHDLLLGKPFLVHLPSRPAVLEIGRWQQPIRVPDWRRIRYIR